jgi:5-formyltetrahydrofolate cyclo-ligase
MPTKKSIRQTLLSQRNALSAHVVTLAATKILEKIKQRKDFLAAEVVALYSDFQNEVPTHLIIDFLLAQNKTVALPVIKNKHMGFYVHAADAVVKNSYGITEPDLKCSRQVALAECDLVVLPGVAFDARGGRVGRGAGFYDRALEKVVQCAQRPRLLALAYDFQLIDSCPTEPHDVRMDEVLVVPT